MLYYLFRALGHAGMHYASLWSFVSFRAILALLLGLIISASFGQYFIRWMRRRGIGETARDYAIDPFGEQKKGVPSMGGLIILAAVLIPSLLLGRLRNIYLITVMVSTVLYGLIGFADDYIKIFRKNKEGLSSRCKLVAQLVIGLGLALTIYFSPDIVVHQNIERKLVDGRMEIVHTSQPVKSNATTIPFYKANNLDFSRCFNYLGEAAPIAGWGLFFVLLLVCTIGSSNATNLNDGMDGMAAGNAAIVCLALGLLAYVSSHIEMAAYLNIMFIPGAEELVIFICALLGGLLGFLWYNAYPAQVFMGDTGSLALGGILGTIAVLIHKEFLLAIIGFVFVSESLSVLLQTSVYKLTKGSRRGPLRLFRAAPIHDAFRKTNDQLPKDSRYWLRNWPKHPSHEAKITLRFWLVSIGMAALGILLLKLR